MLDVRRTRRRAIAPPDRPRWLSRSSETWQAPPALEAAAHEIDPSDARIATLAGDVGDPRTGRAIVDLAERRFGGLELLANNAGVFRPKSFVDVTEEEYDWFLDTILKGKFFTAQAARALQRRGGGAIVHTGSLWAIQAVGATPSAAYSAANAGVHALVRNLALELAPHRTAAASMPSRPRWSKLRSTGRSSVTKR